MKIGDVIAKIGELISAVETAENNTAPTPATIIINNNPGATAPEETHVSPNGETESGNDKEPEDLFLPPLQQKQELLKKAVGVSNIYDDGRPDDRLSGCCRGRCRGGGVAPSAPAVADDPAGDLAGPARPAGTDLHVRQ